MLAVTSQRAVMYQKYWCAIESIHNGVELRAQKVRYACTYIYYESSTTGKVTRRILTAVEVFTSIRSNDEIELHVTLAMIKFVGQFRVAETLKVYRLERLIVKIFHVAV